MGNVLGRQGPEWMPNIPPDGNDLNRPYSAQMNDMILHYAVPLFCIAALGKSHYTVCQKLIPAVF